MAGEDIRIGVEVDGLDALARALRAEADGKELRKELAKGFRQALEPARRQARSNIMGMASAGLGGRPSVRRRVSQKIMPEVKIGGRWTGARLKAKRISDRSFWHAPKRLNAENFRATSWGRGERTQIGRPGWFDDATAAAAGPAREAALEAMENMARRIADRAESE